MPCAPPGLVSTARSGRSGLSAISSLSAGSQEHGAAQQPAHTGTLEHDNARLRAEVQTLTEKLRALEHGEARLAPQALTGAERAELEVAREILR